VKRATVVSRFWEDPSFQNHANRQADATLKALTILATYSSAQKHLRSDAIGDLAISTIGFLYRYENTRQVIPSESKWYPSEYQHPDFYTAGDLNIEMAVQTGGSVQPITVAQANWVEDAVLPVVFKALQTNLEEGNEGSALRVLNALVRYVERLGQLWEVEEAIAIAEGTARVIAPVAFSTESAATDSPPLAVGFGRALMPLTNHSVARVRQGLGECRAREDSEFTKCSEMGKI
jgi:hypothetical protein